MASSSPVSGSSDNVDITGARAVVQWSGPNGQVYYMCSSDSQSSESGQITFDLHFRPSASAASFRLRAPIMLKGLGRKITPFFLFISPERVQSLVYSGPEETQVPDDVQRQLGSSGVVSLRFTLTQPADLIAPPHSPVVPKKKAYWDILDSLKLLSQEINLVIYLKQEQELSGESVTSLCQALSAGKLTTSTPHTDISRLYDGKGGKILTVSDFEMPASVITESPPSYDELGPPPPAPPIKADSQCPDSSSNSRKRRRRSSSVPDGSTTDGSTVDTGNVEAICRKLMGEMTAKWREESEQMRSELYQMESRMKEWVDDRLRKHLDDIKEETQRVGVQQQNQVDDQIQEIRIEVQDGREETQETFDRIDEVKEDIERFRDETSDLVDSRLDERLDTLRSELEEYVTDQVHEAGDRVIDRLRSSVFIDFNIYDS